MRPEAIPFNRPYMTGKELFYIAQSHFNGQLAGDGPFTAKCHQWIENHSGCVKALLTHSCTAALEMAAMLLEIKPGDEVVMPSFTFVSTANAFALRGATIVFVDIREDTLNLDETLIEPALSPRTRAIVPVHYAGVGCEMDAILKIARKFDLKVVEDAAHGIMAAYKEKSLGNIGHLGTFSFHETKNIISGEGGALLINDPSLIEKAQVIREKGTDRTKFFNQEVDKYTWQDLGSSFLPGELIAAFLWAQLEEAEPITRARIKSWNVYHRLLEPLELKGFLRRPIIPEHCRHNAHTYYVLLPPKVEREELLKRYQKECIGVIFHYVPLHTSPAGLRFGRVSGSLSITNSVSRRIIRLPLWIGISEEDQEAVIEILFNYFSKL
jgi:dTDP-4-amino-4,6-dideoxygalactose transaminase